jgi:uncharacterized protein (TIGR02284 family)
MNTNKDAQINGLNTLITTLYDGEYGYKEAASNVASVALKQTFTNIAQQRYNFGHEIKPEIAKLGGEVDKGSSVAAGLHRTWMDLKSAIATNEEAAILAECIRGEQAAIEAYEEVLKQTAFSTATRMIIDRQLDSIRRNLTEMKRLETAYAAA